MYTADLLKDKLTSLYEKYGWTMPEDLTMAYKKLSGVQSFKFVKDDEMTVEQMFENETTDNGKEYVFNSLVRLLPHGAKGIDWEDTPNPESTVPDIDPEPIPESTADPNDEPESHSTSGGESEPETPTETTTPAPDYYEDVVTIRSEAIGDIVEITPATANNIFTLPSKYAYLNATRNHYLPSDTGKILKDSADVTYEISIVDAANMRETWGYIEESDHNLRQIRLIDNYDPGAVAEFMVTNSTNSSLSWTFKVAAPGSSATTTPPPTDTTNDTGDKPSEIEVETESTEEPVKAEWDFIYDEDSWNAAYEKPTMQAYYEWSDRINKPYKEDLYNTVEGRAANSNDAREDSNGEKVVDENGNYIYDNCERCWEGAINAPGAKYPWAVVTLPEGFEGVIKFVYDGGEPVYPFGEESKQFQNTFGVVSIPNEFGDEYLLNSNGETTFDHSKLEILLVK